MKRCLVFVLAFALLLFGGCADGLYLKDAGSPNEDSIAALPDDNSVQKFKSTIYFGIKNENYLVPELREVSQGANESIAHAVVRELINGPADANSQIIVNKNTKILSITTNNDFVYLSVSKDILDVPAAVGAWDKDQATSLLVYKQRRMAIYSLVNTLTELSNCAYVQLYVDLDMDGVAEKITRGQVGFVGDGNEGTYLDALSRNHEYILTPTNTVRLVMELISKNQPQRLYQFVSAVDDYGNPISYSEFEEIIGVNNVVIGSYTVDGDASVSNFGNTFIVLTDYSLKSVGSYNATVYNDVPVNVVRKGNYYCVDIDFIKKVLKG